MRLVRIATWNVNSVKQRLPRLLPWLDERRPDIVCLQETKLADDAFEELLRDELADRGYEIAVHGEASWNGVATQKVTNWCTPRRAALSSAGAQV